MVSGYKTGRPVKLLFNYYRNRKFFQWIGKSYRQGFMRIINVPVFVVKFKAVGTALSGTAKELEAIKYNGVAAVKNAKFFPEFCRLKLMNAQIEGFQ